jgi:hypothetical protein
MDLLAGDVELTEFEAMDVESIKGVGQGANGFPILIMKGLPLLKADGGGGDVECPTCHGDGKILDGKRDCPDCGAEGTVSPAKARELASKAVAQEPEAVAGKPCPTCGQKVDGSVVRAHVRRKKAEQDAAKSLVRGILKAVTDGKVDEDPDIKGGTEVIAQIADLIISEAQELKAGQAGEIDDIRQLAAAAELIWCWRTGEEAVGSGSVMPATALMASAAKAKSGPSAGERRQAAKDGNALPDGSYPIRNEKELRSAAVLARSGHGDVAAAKKLIARRAKELGVKNPLEDGDASKSQIADGETTVDTETRNDGLAKAVEDALAKAVAPLKDDLKVIGERLAKVEAAPIPGGPVLSANVQVKRPGGIPQDTDLAAKAALMRQKAEEATAPADRAGYLAYARELDEQARKAAASA